LALGRGSHCDGQVLVVNDLLGLTERPPKFAKKYVDMRAAMQQAFGAYKADVESGAFPAPEHEC